MRYFKSKELTSLGSKEEIALKILVDALPPWALQSRTAVTVVSQFNIRCKFKHRNRRNKDLTIISVKRNASSKELVDLLRNKIDSNSLNHCFSFTLELKYNSKSSSPVMWYTWLAHGPPSPSGLQAVKLPYVSKVRYAVALDAHHPPC